MIERSIRVKPEIKLSENGKQLLLGISKSIVKQSVCEEVDILVLVSDRAEISNCSINYHCIEWNIEFITLKKPDFSNNESVIDSHYFEHYNLAHLAVILDENSFISLDDLIELQP